MPKLLPQETHTANIAHHKVCTNIAHVAEHTLMTKAAYCGGCLHVPKKDHADHELAFKSRQNPRLCRMPC